MSASEKPEANASETPCDSGVLGAITRSAAPIARLLKQIACTDMPSFFFSFEEWPSSIHKQLSKNTLSRVPGEPRVQTCHLVTGPAQGPSLVRYPPGNRRRQESLSPESLSLYATFTIY